MNEYLRVAMYAGVEPNFWMSTEYIKKAGLLTADDAEWIWVEDAESDDMLMVFPPMDIVRETMPMDPAERMMSGSKIWSDVVGFNPPPGKLDPEDLDWEFLYNPEQFQKMDGKDWAVFRKNCRKWPKDREWFYQTVGDFTRPHPTEGEIMELFAEWVQNKGPDTFIYDLETMVLFLKEGTYRAFLWEGSRLAAINVWDENWKYLNFRYNVCRAEDFLSEFSRLQFYLDPRVYKERKLVNDGGSLDNEGLRAFKEKMNPTRKRRVRSWRIN
jgi:hypothetical protein